MDKITAYILIMLCVILTAIAVGIVFFVIYLIKINVIDDIISDIRDSRDDYWKKQYEKMQVDRNIWRDRFRMLRISEDMIPFIYSITTERRDDLNERGNIEVRILLEVRPEEGNNDSITNRTIL